MNRYKSFLVRLDANAGKKDQLNAVLDAWLKVVRNRIDYFWNFPLESFN